MACADVDALVSRAIDQITVLRICAGFRCAVPHGIRCSKCPEMTKELMNAAKKLVSVAKEIESLLLEKGP
jgi:bacterioferritin-associated ferredoxin